MILTDELRYQATPGHLAANAAGDLVLLHRDSGVYFGLNSVAKRVWELLQQERTIDWLVKVIVSEYEVDSDLARRDIEDLLANLSKERLVQVFEVSAARIG